VAPRADERRNFDLAQDNHGTSATHPPSECDADKGQQFNIPQHESHDALAMHPPIHSQMPTNFEPLAEPELTPAGRRAKRWDMTGLSLCLCGERAQSGDTGSIKCQRAGCETVWVSGPSLLALEGSRLNDILSIILNVSTMRTHDQEIGFARLVH
jgi:hypothetical protein